MIRLIDDMIRDSIYKIIVIVIVLSMAFGIGMYIAHITAGTPKPTDTAPTAHELLDRIPDTE